MEKGFLFFGDAFSVGIGKKGVVPGSIFLGPCLNGEDNGGKFRGGGGRGLSEEGIEGKSAKVTVIKLIERCEHVVVEQIGIKLNKREEYDE